MKILITGTSGFIGSHVLEHAIIQNDNHQIISTSRNMGGLIDTKNNYLHIPFTISDETLDQNLFKLFGEPDLMIHLAWEGLPDYMGKVHTERNLPLQFSFIRNLVSNGLKKVAVTGTCFEYGLQSGKLNEELNPQPVTEYGKAKNLLRIKLQDLTKEMKFDFVWLRLFYMYGEGQNKNSLFPMLDRKIAEGAKEIDLSGGEQLRDYLRVEKMAELIYKISVHPLSAGIYNCCSGNPVRLRSMIEEYVSSRQNQEIKLNFGRYPYNDYEPLEFWGDNSKAENLMRK
ncbi:MAG: NAD(P)-dependent oxidoreductase [Bacteroidetes bacterium]|nr:MAG: NAD(P)-dependent oxidoreductase [Bacteroidota bacterium]REK32909.1 MAG: NAD(P)-dependent oxidoreductase [Bacteroidota bacterium]